MARECGLSNVVLFPITKDEAGTQPTFGTAIPVRCAVSIETENQYAEGSYYSDNIVENATKKLTMINITMEMSSNIPPALDAQIVGKGYKDGKAYNRAGAGDEPRYAIAYEILMDDGNIRRRIIYNANIKRNTQANKTVEDAVEGQTYTYEGSGIPLISTHDVDMVMDKAEIEALSDPNKSKILEQFNKFFTTVILPDTPLTAPV